MNSHEEAEKAAFASLSEQQQAAIAYYKAKTAAARRTIVHAEELAAFAREVSRDACVDWTTCCCCERVREARAILAKIDAVQP